MNLPDGYHLLQSRKQDRPWWGVYKNGEHAGDVWFFDGYIYHVATWKTLTGVRLAPETQLEQAINAVIKGFEAQEIAIAS